MTKAKAVTVVVPVYADWPSLQECIESLKKYVDTNHHKIILVNDCGPEADLMEKNILAAIKKTLNFEYYRNKKNIGFVRTCNRAVNELDKSSNDILLLNSDTKVTESFLEEMLEALYSQSNIGVLSPRSNNATICTLPLSAMTQKGLDPNISYELFQKYSRKFPVINETPTAHGFCMLIRKDVIKRFGLFDTIFGKGYGEEVDFCQRIRQQGWISALCNHAFVFHLEARSFTLETKARLLEENNKIIRQRYPEYKQSVRDYIDIALIKESKILPNSKIINKLKSIKSFVKKSKLTSLAKTIKK